MKFVSKLALAACAIGLLGAAQASSVHAAATCTVRLGLNGGTHVVVHDQVGRVIGDVPQGALRIPRAESQSRLDGVDFAIIDPPPGFLVVECTATQSTVALAASTTCADGNLATSRSTDVTAGQRVVFNVRWQPARGKAPAILKVHIAQNGAPAGKRGR